MLILEHKLSASKSNLLTCSRFLRSGSVGIFLRPWIGLCSLRASREFWRCCWTCWHDFLCRERCLFSVNILPHPAIQIISAMSRSTRGKRTKAAIFAWPRANLAPMDWTMSSGITVGQGKREIRVTATSSKFVFRGCFRKLAGLSRSRLQALEHSIDCSAES